jgi:transglutaminase-like putative cysteine protease
LESIKRLTNQIIPILLAVAAVNWMLVSLTGSFQIIVPIISLIISSCIFGFYNYIQKNSKLKVLLFVLFAVLYFVLLGVIAAFGGRYVSLLLVSVYGFTSVFYYFTVVRYRVGLVFLTGMIPFLIYFSRAEKKLTLSFAFFIILFFIVYYERERKKSNFGSEESFNKNSWYYLSMIFGVIVVFIVAMLIPKPDLIPQIYYLNTVISEEENPEVDASVNDGQDYLSDIAANVFNPVNNMSQRRMTTQAPPLSKRVLFEVEADGPLYLKIRVWDKYENNSWKLGNQELEEYQPVRNIYWNQVKYDILVSLLKRAKEQGAIPPVLSEHTELWDLDSVTRRRKFAVIYNTSRVFSRSLPVPVGILDAYYSSDWNEYINQLGMCKVYPERGADLWNYYKIEYIPQKLALNSLEYRLIKVLNRKIAKELLNFESRKNDQATVLGMVAAELDHSYKNYTQLPPNISPRIYQLAESITEGKKSDFDKAEAIEQYFHTSGFVYDLTPPRIPAGAEINDYFLFETKRGFCVHYASAMVILARACGLPARFAEGYVANEIEKDTGRYIVREKNGHAFPEVYIAGYGWMVFEPTVSSNEVKSTWTIAYDHFWKKVKFLETSLSKAIGISPVWVRIVFIPFVTFILLFLVWVLRKLYIKVWIDKNLVLESDQAVYRIFSRVIKLLGVANLEMLRGETPSEYERRIYEKTGLDLSDLIQIFNKSKYAGIKPSQNDVKVGINVYKDVVAYVRSCKGRFNLWRYIWLV